MSTLSQHRQPQNDSSEVPYRALDLHKSMGVLMVIYLPVWLRRGHICTDDLNLVSYSFLSLNVDALTSAAGKSSAISIDHIPGVLIYQSLCGCITRLQSK
jgi:hypothetical protein